MPDTSTGHPLHVEPESADLGKLNRPITHEDVFPRRPPAHYLTGDGVERCVTCWSLVLAQDVAAHENWHEWLRDALTIK